MKIYDLKVMHMKNPVIDRRPEFSWKIESTRQNVLQRAYRIVVRNKDGILWDTGKVESRCQAFVEYEGEGFKTAERYEWTVTVWDNYEEVSSASDWFETAFLRDKDWCARWIECTIDRQPASEYSFGAAYPPVLFEREFDTCGEIESARVYATSHGVYVLKVNGKRADDREFAPEFTRYDKIMYYQTYDVTKLLLGGKNSLEMYVGDGWYFSTQARPVMEEYHKEPSVLFQLEIRYKNGTIQTVASDGTEKCSLGHIVYSDLYQGEKQDYRIKNTEKYPVDVKDYGYEFLRSQPIPPVRPVRLLPAVEVITTPAGEKVVDFGQVIAGRARVKIDALKDQEITLEYFEVLDQDGNYINTMFAPQKDIVISDGKPIEHEAKFTFHGFRYIRVGGLEEVRKEDFTAVLLTTEKENKGEFRCSDERLNRLYQNVRWSQYNNMMSVPTDCPTREKAGWTGDLLIYAKTALMNEEMTPFLSSWLDIVRADQQDDGVIRIVAPYMKLYEALLLQTVKKFGDEKVTGVAGWSDAIVWVPYDMYRMTGNARVLRDNFEAMESWCEYIIRTAEEKRGYHDIPYDYDRYLWNTGFHFGEWLVPSRPDDTGEQYGICKESAFYIAPFFGYMTLLRMKEICRVLGEKEKEERYADRSKRMKEAIQKGILLAGLLPEYLMGGYILAFAFDLVPEELYDSYKKHLTDLIRKNGNCLDTGFLATPFILDTLCKIGEKELAYALLWQDKRPSWLYEVDHGATTIWEAWDADDAKSGGRYVSFDHYAFGCVDEWICRHIAGIDSDTPGFSHVIIRPDGGKRLTSCERTFECEAGTIKVAWDEKGLCVSIPCNVTATVEWDGEKTEIGSGDYFFR
ncbi:MAG: glycoside hydrolase family 78 protein [Faecalicatena sp.]|uniref:family 78 glycoside hydrolase catalytic domain n=1 Tax=Faecalicatena sp. TaxID=2005360 RepID=UPI00258FAADD|nr:family 78 glycoside hydrolase catalytic domain [Faecalicatena sp.]MCI6465711.1 glycoside hydrolase family 78 protein [Faecalicatena sp.]MDY5618014.1 family 78 glycoside hydrolase catalytic domain [Lachnospiraceae bacterium]